MLKYTFDFERYKEALRLTELIKFLLSPAAEQPEIEVPHLYNLLDNIIVVDGAK